MPTIDFGTRKYVGGPTAPINPTVGALAGSMRRTGAIIDPFQQQKAANGQLNPGLVTPGGWSGYVGKQPTRQLSFDQTPQALQPPPSNLPQTSTTPQTGQGGGQSPTPGPSEGQPGQAQGVGRTPVTPTPTPPDSGTTTSRPLTPFVPDPATYGRNAPGGGTTGTPVTATPGGAPDLGYTSAPPPGMPTGTPVTATPAGTSGTPVVPGRSISGITGWVPDNPAPLPKGTPAPAGMYVNRGPATATGGNFVMPGDSPVINNFNALMKQYGADAAYNYMSNNFNAADWQSALKSSFGVEGMNNIINRYGPSGKGYSYISRNPDGSFKYYDATSGNKNASFVLPYDTGGRLSATRQYWTNPAPVAAPPAPAPAPTPAPAPPPPAGYGYFGPNYPTA